MQAVPPADDRPVLGWANRAWTKRTPCCVCRRSIRAGVVHHKDQADPPSAAMCLADYNLLMWDPDRWREEHPSEQL